jgi:multisubunit Na+/H+ antiporter MnhB subunit
MTTTVLTKMVARMILLPVYLIAIGILVKGYADTGDGFSAGAVAALGVGLQIMVFGPQEIDRLPLVRFAPAGTFAGLAIALVTVFVPAIRGQALFTHWPPAGEHAVHFGTLEFITAVVFDVGVFLIVFGFGVGIIGAIARAESRMVRAEQRAALRHDGRREDAR